MAAAANISHIFVLPVAQTVLCLLIVSCYRPAPQFSQKADQRIDKKRSDICHHKHLLPPEWPHTYDTDMPITRHTTAITAELITTLLNVRHTRMEVSAGKIIRLEIKSAPIIRIPSTIVTAVSTAISVLYRSAFTPVAWANVSSNVIANILL